MTLSTEITLPAIDKEIVDDSVKMERYLRDLTRDLEQMYIEVAEGVNGNIKTNDSLAQDSYTPEVFSSGAAEGTGTYDHQIGWVLRKGIIVDTWFDVQWTAHTGTAGVPMYISLPYLVAQSAQKPFVGVLYSSNITFAGSYITCNAAPNTRRCNIWTSTSAGAGAQVNLDTTGQFAGHIRYIGQGIERT